jgi:hypothetical protein
MASVATNYSNISEVPESADEISEFVRIGRTGRRNAIADVSASTNSAEVSANSLTEMMRNVNCGTSGDGKG